MRRRWSHGIQLLTFLKLFRNLASLLLTLRCQKTSVSCRQRSSGWSQSQFIVCNRQQCFAHRSDQTRRGFLSLPLHCSEQPACFCKLPFILVRRYTWFRFSKCLRHCARRQKSLSKMISNSSTCKCLMCWLVFWTRFAFYGFEFKNFNFRHVTTLTTFSMSLIIAFSNFAWTFCRHSRRHLIFHKVQWSSWKQRLWKARKLICFRSCSICPRMNCRILKQLGRLPIRHQWLLQYLANFRKCSDNWNNLCACF